MDDFRGNSYVNVDDDKDFYKLADLIGNNIQKIIHNVSSMNKIVTQLNKIQDAAHVKRKLREISNYTQQLTTETSHHLKALHKIRHSTEAEQMQFKIQKERLSDRFKSALCEFQATQSKVYDKENELTKQTQLSSECQVLIPPSSSKHRNDYLTFKANDQNQTQLQIQYTVDPKVIEREQAIKEMENNVVVVAEMYQQLNDYVGQQGDTVNTIEINVNDTYDLIDEGNENLQKASKYIIKSRRKTCYLTVICAVIIIIIIYFVFK